MTFAIEVIGHVRGGRADPVDDDWGSNRTTIELDTAQVGADALAGLDGFSHAEIIFLFDRALEDKIERGARHPRGRKDWPLTGILAQRGKTDLTGSVLRSAVFWKLKVRGCMSKVWTRSMERQ